jgi:O-antigen/teichoic acid export membrane protein
MLKRINLKIINNIYILSLLKKGNTIIFGLIATVFLNRALGPTLKGEYAYILNTISTLVVIMNLGISTIFPNYMRTKETWILSTFIALSCVQFTIYLFLGIGIAFYFQSMQVFIWAFAVAISVLALQLLNISVVTNFKAGVIANSLAVIINSILLFLMFALEIQDINYAFIIYIIKEIIVVVIGLFFLKGKIYRDQVIVSEWGKIIRAGFIPMLTNLLIVLNYKIDILVLKFLDVDFYSIGLYSVGLSLAEYAWVIPDIFKDVLINKTAKSDNLSSVSFCLRLSSTSLIFIYIFLLLFSKQIIIMMFGNEYANAYLITNIIFLGVYSMVYCKLLGTLFLAQGKWNFYFLVLLGAVSINIVSNLIVIPFLGIYGAAITSIASYSFAGFRFLICFIKRYNLSAKSLLFINRSDIKHILSFVKSMTVKGGKRSDVI